LGAHYIAFTMINLRHLLARKSKWGSRHTHYVPSKMKAIRFSPASNVKNVKDHFSELCSFSREKSKWVHCYL
jgi:hypothetical protein